MSNKNYLNNDIIIIIIFSRSSWHCVRKLEAFVHGGPEPLLPSQRLIKRSTAPETQQPGTGVWYKYRYNPVTEEMEYS